MSTIITSVDRHSPAERAGITPGEQLLTINGHQIIDVLDYRFYGYDTDCCLELREPAGTVRTVSLRKPEGRDLGLNFDTVLMDDMRSCANHCIFCFVDQMPPGMRKTLYFKDDDARLSFLQGNYITLTNLTDREAQRIIDLRISPINVSVHTTDPQLHCTMLGNKNALRSLDYIRAFCKAGIDERADRGLPRLERRGSAAPHPPGPDGDAVFQLLPGAGGHHQIPPGPG